MEIKTSMNISEDYLENIINDDVSQYKFYQGMLQDKGTKNSLTKIV